MMARLALRMALASPRVRADVMEVNEFPHYAQRYQVMGVPKTIINEAASIEGAVPEKVFVARLQQVLGGKG